jgi:ABC-type sugar transport system substrate-binding protein
MREAKRNAAGSRAGGRRVMTDLLTAFPKIDAVFSINDEGGICVPNVLCAFVLGATWRLSRLVERTFSLLV